MILIKLLLAHLIGDFFFNQKNGLKKKKRKKLKSPKLYFHVLIHIIITILILWDLSLWPLVVLIGTSHFIIDTVKLSIQKKKTKRLLFFIDQFLHILVIVIGYLYLSNDASNLKIVITDNILLLITCLLFLTIPTSIIMKTIFLKWNISKLHKNNESLQDAGKYIGILERLLVFIFIILNHWEAVGFLITAKSVFRFGDLKESKDRQLTEYILIGTLISFGLAIITGILYNIIAHV